MMNQRDYDIARLQAQIKIMKMVEEWKLNFLKGRVPMTPPGGQVEEPMTSTAAPGEVTY
jgi:hypothetical protein